MGKKCLVHRDNNDNITVKIADRNNIYEIARQRNGGHDFNKTPDGKSSELYKNLVEELQLEPEFAREFIANTFSDDFGKWFGRWWDGGDFSRFVDVNGQPKLYFLESQSDNKGLYTSEPNYGVVYSLTDVDKFSDHSYGNIYPVFINGRNPIAKGSDIDITDVIPEGKDSVIGVREGSDVIVTDISNHRSIYEGTYLSEPLSTVYKQKDSGIVTVENIELEHIRIVADVLQKKGLVRKVHFKTEQEIQDKLKEYGEESIIRVLPGVNSEISGDQRLYSSGELGENNSGTEQGNEGGQYRIKYHLVPVSDSSKAEDLEKQGLSELGIKRQTGLERGRDGIWRKEIPTKEIDLSGSKFKRVWHGDFDILEEADLTNIYNNEELYKEFPQLKNTAIYLYEGFKHDPEDTNEGFQYGGHVFINKRRNREDKSRRKHLLFHEIQHIIQRASGTSGGTNFDRMLGEIESRYSRLDKDTGGDTLFTRVLDEHVKDLTKGDYNSLSELPSSEFGRVKRALAQRMYDSKYGEIEAETSARRGLLPNQDLRNVTLFKDQDMYTEQGVWFSDSDLKYHLIPVSEAESSLAKDLIDKGENELSVKRRTGLERGRDGIWRKEIRVSNIDLDSSHFKKVRHQDFESLEEADLTDIYNNEELYKEFPQLKDTAVYLYEGFNGDPGNTSEGFQYGGHIFINKRFTDAKGSRRKHILLHEIQHIIQRASGTSHGTNFPRLLDEITRRYSRPKNEVDSDSLFSKVLDAKVELLTNGKHSSIYTLSQEEFDTYKKELSWMMYDSKYGEVEAETAARRGLLPNQDLRNITLFSQEDRFTEQGVWYDDSDLVDDIRYSSDSQINGFYDPRTRQIWINKDNSRKILGTTIHEFAHPYLDYIEVFKSDLFSTGIEMVKKNKENLKYYFDRISEHYSSLPENEQFKEVLAEIIADEGVKIANKKTRRSFLYWLTDFFKEIGNIIGFSRKTPKQISNMTVQSIAKSMLADMFDGNSFLSSKALRVGQLSSIGHNYTTNLVARERFDIDNLERIGAGSDRVTYDLGEGKVLKIAKTARGLAQNMAETDIYLTGHLLPQVYEVGLNYNVVDKVDQMKASDKIPLFKEGEETGEFTTAKKMMEDLANLSYKDYDLKTDLFYETMDKYDLHDAADYNVMIGDFSRIRNWGMKNGYPIHLDGGTFNANIISEYRNVTNMSDSDFREVYERSLEARSFFDDLSTNYKFSIEGKLETPDTDVVSELYDEIKSIPGITQEQALDIYKTIYTKDFMFHKQEQLC